MILPLNNLPDFSEESLILNQTWGQFHFVNSSSTGQFHVKFINSKFINSSSIFYLLQSLIRVATPRTYLEYLLWVVYIPSRIIMEEIFLDYKIKWYINFGL